MSTVVKAEGTFDVMEARGVHQPWMSALGPMRSSLESIVGELYLPAAVAHFMRLQSGERLWDGAVALLFVAACAATGWVGSGLL